MSRIWARLRGLALAMSLLQVASSGIAGELAAGDSVSTEVATLAGALRMTPALSLPRKFRLKRELDRLRVRAAGCHGQPWNHDTLRVELDSLIDKVSLLLEAQDPLLAARLHRSRDGIWHALTSEVQCR